MLYDNEGRPLDTASLLSEFYNLEPVDSLAQRYGITEEQVFEVVGGEARVETLGARYDFNFNSERALVTRRPYPHGVELAGDERPLTLLSILRWRPCLILYLILPGNDFPSRRVTSVVTGVTFR